MIYHPAPYQLEGTRQLLEHDNFGLLFDPGLGKTATVLHALKALKIGQDRPLRALVIAPRLVCVDTWPNEIAKWDQFKDLGHVQLRNEKEIDFKRDETIWLINPEVTRLSKLFDAVVGYILGQLKIMGYRGLDDLFAKPNKWAAFTSILRARPGLWPFDVLVNDESSKFKNPSSKRFKLLKKFLPFFPRRYILTGTFAPNGLLDIFSQCYIMDLGETFGQYVTQYRKKYFEIDNPKFFTYKIRPGAEREIQRQVAPMVMRLDAAKHLDLPDLVHNRIKVTLPKKAQQVYDDIEKDFLAELDDGDELVALNSTSKYLLCRQLANGSYYDPQTEDKRVLPMHKAKTERLKLLIDELNGKPLLVAYVYRADLEQIEKEIKGKVPSIGGHTSERQARAYLDQWNRRELPVLCAQCSSISHGLNMQAGGNDLCFYSLTDNLEDYEQLIRRIYRRGVKGQVRVHYLLADETIDAAVYRRIKSKEQTERTLLEAIEEYRREKYGS
jgi:SNF2 family DNA or RNA helicase